MKTLLHLLFFSITFISILFYGCAEPIVVKEKNLEYLDENVLADKVTVYKYRFSFNSKAWMEISAYVKKENKNYIISINDSSGINLNSFTYIPDINEQNLITSNRVRPFTVSNLKEAIEKSIVTYLEDNI